MTSDSCCARCSDPTAGSPPLSPSHGEASVSGIPAHSPSQGRQSKLLVEDILENTIITIIIIIALTKMLTMMMMIIIIIIIIVIVVVIMITTLNSAIQDLSQYILIII